MSHSANPKDIMSIHQELLEHPEHFDFSIRELGPRAVPSPVVNRNFVEDSKSFLYYPDVDILQAMQQRGAPLPAFQSAGPRSTIFHDPIDCRAGIVTCGGLCPGLNDVIKGLVEILNHDYGVSDVLGFRYGYRGLIPEFGHEPMPLTVEGVDGIHMLGGTILGSSRGRQDTGDMVDRLEELGIRLLFCVGGDGTLRGASDLADEITRRGLPISVIGIPKTIDNDLNFIRRSFGFETAVYATFDVLSSAHMEAKGALNGISIVKVMGRDSGYIAAAATLANSVVNFCLIPECPFALDGEHGLLRALERRLCDESDHAVIVVAEGAGQDLFSAMPERRDASGNILKNDIGALLSDRIHAYFKERDIPHGIKYFDPSYSIRSVAARGTDAIYCHVLADQAVHAAMAGKTDMVIGQWNQRFTHVPIDLATRERQKIDPEGPEWKAVTSSTRQNTYFGI